MTDAEHKRMENAGHPENGWREASPWYEWGPYLSERAWGGVREDYSAGGDAWDSFPHDHARSRAYRWNEDGMAGMTDVFNRLTLALALWNGKDPIIKERMFGLSGPEGNHGEDVKDYWWYLDAIPSSAWLRWRYHYPQAAFPYEDLVTTNRGRSKFEPEYELLDTGVFDDDRYWIVEVHYAKASPTDVLMRVTVRNRGPETATLHVLPTLWFRNEWAWNPDQVKPELRAGPDGRSILATHPELGDYTLEIGPAPDGTAPTLLFCENETNRERIEGVPNTTPYPKDGINDHLIGGTATVNPDGVGTKASPWYRLDVPAGETVELRLRLHKTARAAKPRSTTVPAVGAEAEVTVPAVATAATAGEGNGKAAADEVAPTDPLGPSFESTMRRREGEADDFYAALSREGMGVDEQRVMRQAFAGMLWSKQYYGYNVARWLDGDPGLPPPPPERLTARNATWRHFEAADIISMPDPWEYPWFAAWDLAFHAVTFAHIDPAFAKYQLLLLCREWFQHPHGALPAYEWSFDDVNPPVHAAAAYLVWTIDGRKDDEFLRRIFHKLLLNFTWWLNRQDKEGNDLFSGGFLGLDNIGAFDRSHLPAGTELEQSDATAWMFMYCLNMLRIATVLVGEGSRLRGLPDHVHGARRADRRGDEPERSVGRGGRLLLRRPQARRRLGHPDQGPFHGRPDPAPAGRVDPGGDGPARAIARKAVRELHGVRASQRRTAARGRLHHRPSRSPEPPAERGPAGPAGQAAGRDAVRGGVPVAARACGRCRSAIATSRSSSSLAA